MDTLALVMEGPEKLALKRLGLIAMGANDVTVAIDYSGISTGTEKLLWTGRMPPFPGMGYPLVPGYESVGRVVDAGADAAHAVGSTVFVPGANCYTDARGLFGGAARTIVLPLARAVPVSDKLGSQAVLIALAATAQHAIAGGELPDLIVGHGVLGRLLARLAVAAGGSPTVWEIDPVRSEGAEGYEVVHPDRDDRRDYRCIHDVSGDSNLIDTLVGRLGKRGEIVLAGFYADRLSFAFPGAFLREARFRVAAEWAPDDLAHVQALIADGRLALGGLISHVRPFDSAADAYPQAFSDRACLKMLLDWRGCA